MNLYEIEKEYLELFEKAENLTEDSTNEQVNELTEALQINEANFNNKALSYCKYIKNLEGQQNSIDLEIERLNSLKKSKKLLIEKLKNNLSQSMQSLGKDKVDLDIFKLSFRKSKSTDTEELEKRIISIDINHDHFINSLTNKIFREFPEVEFCNVSINIKPNKTLIKTAIVEGKEILGSKIIENISLVIK